MNSRFMRRSPVMLPALMLTVGLAACSSSSSGASTSGSASGAAASTGASTVAAVSKDTAAAALVPAAIAGKGTLSIGSDASYAPSEFLDIDGKTVVGFDADLATALGQVLGLKMTINNAPFGSLVEAVKSGKYDLGMSSFTINADRLKAVDMVSYYQAGTSWAVTSGNQAGVTPDNACGKKIAVQADTVQVDDITARSKTCTAAGKPAITIEQLAKQSDVTSAVVTGKDDGMLADSPVMAYAVKQTGGRLQLVGNMYDAAPYGVAVAKDSGLTKAVQAGMQKLIDSGTYAQILKKWNVDSGAVTKVEIDPKVASQG